MAERLDRVIKTGLLEVHERAKRDASSYITGRRTSDKFFWRGYKFLLEGHMLIYFDSSGDSETGKVKMAYGTKARVYEMTDRMFSFCIDRGLKGRMVLSATSIEERDTWISAINTVCEHNNESFETLRLSFTPESSGKRDPPSGEKRKEEKQKVAEAVKVPTTPLQSGNMVEDTGESLQVVSDEGEHLLWHTVHVLTALIIVGVQVWKLYSSIPSYMDEIFHVTQAQKVVDSGIDGGLLTQGAWDPKITTFPGTYLLSAGLHSMAAVTAGACYQGVHFLSKHPLVPLVLKDMLPTLSMESRGSTSSSNWGWTSGATTIATSTNSGGGGDALLSAWLEWGIDPMAATCSTQSLRLGNMIIGALTFVVAVRPF